MNLVTSSIEWCETISAFGDSCGLDCVYVFFLSYIVPRILIPYQLLACLSVAVLSFFTSLIAALYFNAGWHRKTEIE